MNLRASSLHVLYALFASLATIAAAAADSAPPAVEAAENGPVRMETMTIIGNPDAIDRIGGAVQYLSHNELDTFRYADVMRVLRAVPGVYLQDEEGFGLRPNIGIRGSGLDRSSRIALLEDGVLIAPAPYSAPAAYYFPTQRRINAMEVLKGPASIRVGSRTTGGAVNLLSTPIPASHSMLVDAGYGQDDYRELHAYYGGSTDHLGWLFETVQQDSGGFKDIDGPTGGDTGFDIDDYVAKFRLSTDTDARFFQSLEFKYGYTKQHANETYLGLTDDDFDRDPNRRYAGSQLDEFDSEHKQYQVNHVLSPASRAWELSTTAYYNDFNRNWYKLGHVGGVGISNLLEDPTTYSEEFGWVTGEDSPNDALTVRNNNRDYFSKGVQSIFSTDASFIGADWRFTLGGRYHEDEEDRFQDQDGYRMESGRMILTSDGAPGSQTNRVSDAEVFSMFTEIEMSAGNWIVTPGMRWETIDLRRRDFSTDDPDRSEGPTRTRGSTTDILIPGVGAVYSLTSRLELLGGVSKGFNPPAPGSSADEEESVNWEFGGRFRQPSWSAEVIGFYSDYDNLVGTCTESTGGGCDIGDQFDGGKATVSGVETSVGGRVAGIFGSGIDVPVRLAYTWTPMAQFDSNFESDFEPWGDIEDGDDIPYIPEHQAQLAVGLAASRWQVDIVANYVDKTRTIAGSGSIPGDESTDRYLIFDLAANYSFTERFSAFTRMDNVFDETYIVARRPSGARPGKPQSAMLGFRYTF